MRIFVYQLLFNRHLPKVQLVNADIILTPFVILHITQ